MARPWYSADRHRCPRRRRRRHPGWEEHKPARCRNSVRPAGPRSRRQSGRDRHRPAGPPVRHPVAESPSRFLRPSQECRQPLANRPCLPFCRGSRRLRKARANRRGHTKPGKGPPRKLPAREVFSACRSWPAVAPTNNQDSLGFGARECNRREIAEPVAGRDLLRLSRDRGSKRGLVVRAMLR
jgi:hypothetical protein